jgi:ligand-binding sensor domain-containing protein/signal transduction histidine kinase
MRKGFTPVTFSVPILLACCICSFALDPSQEVSQYAHTAWTVKDRFSLGNVYAMAQTPDGYLWLGGEFGLFRFDGVHATQWQPPDGQRLPDRNINSLLVTRDGTLWIGTFAGLVALNRGKLSRPPAIGDHFVASLFEDSNGTVWVGSLEPSGRLCAIRGGSEECYGKDGVWGRAVWALYEDSSRALWAAAQSGLWRIRPGALKRYATPTELVALNKAENGRLLIAMHGARLLQLVGNQLETYPVRGANNPNQILSDRQLDSNRLLRDRDGGLWIGTVERGLIHVHNGRTDVFTKSDGLSGDIILSLFEDREGNVWVATTGGLDRFRELPVSTISVKQGLTSDATQSVLAATDGNIWLGTGQGLTRWRNGQTTIFRKKDGLPDDAIQALFQDNRGRLWVATAGGLAYLQEGRFVAANAAPRGTMHYISGDNAGNLWISEEKSLLHLRDGRLVEQVPWLALGRQQQANVVLADEKKGGVWLGFWVDGGVSYFKDRQVRLSYTTLDGLARGPVPDLRLDQDEVLWVASEYGGLSRIKDGRISTLAVGNGLPCDTVNATIEDDDRSLWLYTACGLVRITRTELEAWIADPKYKVRTTVWDAADGVRLRSSAASEYGPRVAKSSDGKLWFVTGDGMQVIDPHHLALNKFPPPLHIERIVADNQVEWQNWPGAAVPNLRLPPRVRDLEVDYVGLSLVAPEKMQFRLKLEGQDDDWRVPTNPGHSHYTNLAPKRYRFRVIAANNSGVWNQEGDTLEFVIPPAWYQSNWFRAACVIAFLGMIWGIHELRVRQVAAQFNMRLEERVSERTRIARDLHDTLLQSFQGLVFRFQAVRYQLPDHPEQASEALDGALVSADQAIAEGRNAIQQLRSGQLNENELQQKLLETGHELASSQGGNGGPPLRVIVEGQRRAKRAVITEEVYRIARELLRNAYKHACAQSIEAELRYDDDAFLLVVRDDGKGMDPTILKERGRAGHWGLPGMYERAEGIGARLDIWSQAGAGTEVRLTVPGAIAYEKSGNGRRFNPFRKTRTYEHRS